MKKLRLTVHIGDSPDGLDRYDLILEDDGTIRLASSPSAFGRERFEALSGIFDMSIVVSLEEIR
jgi:hypothetical protein